MYMQKPWKLFWNVIVPSTNALSHLHSDVSEKGDTRLHANNLWQKIEKLKFVFMLQFWTRVLGRFHRVSKAIQKFELSFSTCAKLYSSLVDFLSEMIDKFDEFDQQQKLPCRILAKELSLGDKEMHLRLQVNSLQRIGLE